MKEFIYTLIREVSANTRFVFLAQGLATAFSIMAVTIAFVSTHDPVAREGYSTMMAILVTGGGIGSVAHGWAKSKTGGGTAGNTTEENGSQK